MSANNINCNQNNVGKGFGSYHDVEGMISCKRSHNIPAADVSRVFYRSE